MKLKLLFLILALQSLVARHRGSAGTDAGGVKFDGTLNFLFS